MKRRMAIINIQCDTHTDGTAHIHSPDVPLFHIVESNLKKAWKVALPVLQETIERRTGKNIELHSVMEPQDFMKGEPSQGIPTGSIPKQLIVEFKRKKPQP